MSLRPPGNDPDFDPLPLASPRFFTLLATGLFLLACVLGVAAVLAGYDFF